MIEKNDLLEIYKIFADEEITFINMHQDRVKFFSGLLSGLVAGTVAGLFKSGVWYHFALMSLGPILIIAVSLIAQKSILRLYQRFLEAVTVRAKLEQAIGLTHKQEQFTDEINKNYWKEEPIVATRHLESRLEFDNSKDWLKSNINKGYQKWIQQLFKGGWILGIVFFIVIILLSVLSYHKII